LNGTVKNLLCANDVNLLRINRYIFCVGNERVAVLVTGSEVSLVANLEVKTRKIHNKEGWVNKCFEPLNVWEQP
jgi:hypothetical protein